MDIQELILLNSDKVRRDSNLMAFYIEAFQSAFGHKPNCAGCTFNSDWNKLVKSINKGENLVNLQTTNNKVMSTFKLKKTTNTILAYRKDKITYRKYDNLIDESFAIAYLTNGTESEIIERKKLFAVLPDAISVKSEPIPTMENTAKEMREYADKKGIDVSGLQNKKDLLEAINNGA